MSLTTKITEAKTEGEKIRRCEVERSHMESSHLRTFTSSQLRAFSLCVLCGLLLFLFIMTTGCASSGDVESLKRDVDIERVNDRKEMTQIKSSLDDLSREVASLKDQGVGALKESQSSLLTQVNDLSKSIQVLQGRFDENKYFIDKTLKDLVAERDLLQARIAALENDVKDLKGRVPQTQPSGASPEGAAAPAEEQKEREEKAPSTDYTVPQKLYDDAQIDFKGKRYQEARQKFEKFISDFPKQTLTPNAYFWIGETYFAEKKYEDAILAYENLLKKYPSHDKAKGAMLKQAYAFIEIGDKKTAKVILERIIEKYPRSTEAELAEKKIAEILHNTSGGKKKN